MRRSLGQEVRSNHRANLANGERRTAYTRETAMIENLNITCPKCKADFQLSETFMELLIGTAVEERLASERDSMAVDIQRKTSSEFLAKLQTAQEELLEKDAKLRLAEASELAVRRERRALEEQKRQLELEVERRLQVENAKVRAEAKKEDEDNHRFKLAERDKVIADMRKQIEELRRRSDRGSQQLQGEVLELELEAVLKQAFPNDRIQAV